MSINLDFETIDTEELQYSTKLQYQQNFFKQYQA